MNKFLNLTVAAVCLAGTSLTAISASAAIVGVQVGDLGISVGNGHYYDSHHHMQNYSYPSDWKAYHHPQAWYRSHPQWNDRNHPDFYRN